MHGFSVHISRKTFCYSQVHSPRMSQNPVNTGRVLQSYVTGPSCSLRKNHLLCKVIQPPCCNVNTGAPEASRQTRFFVSHQRPLHLGPATSTVINRLPSNDTPTFNGGSAVDLPLLYNDQPPAGKLSKRLRNNKWIGVIKIIAQVVL